MLPFGPAMDRYTSVVSKGKQSRARVLLEIPSVGEKPTIGRTVQDILGQIDLLQCETNSRPW